MADVPEAPRREADREEPWDRRNSLRKQVLQCIHRLTLENPQRYLYVGPEDIQERTGLSQDEVSMAVKDLRSAGYLKASFITIFVRLSCAGLEAAESGCNDSAPQSALASETCDGSCAVQTGLQSSLTSVAAGDVLALVHALRPLVPEAAREHLDDLEDDVKAGAPRRRWKASMDQVWNIASKLGPAVVKSLLDIYGKAEVQPPTGANV